MNVTWIRWYVLLNVKILIIARPLSSTNLSSLLSSPLLLSRGSWSNIGLYRTDEKECSILTRTTLISLSLSSSIIFAAALVMRIISWRAATICILFRAITRHRMGIRSSTRPHLRSFTIFSGLLLDFATARGTILLELARVGQPMVYLQYESCSDVKLWMLGEVDVEFYETRWK